MCAINDLRVFSMLSREGYLTGCSRYQWNQSFEKCHVSTAGGNGIIEREPDESRK